MKNFSTRIKLLLFPLMFIIVVIVSGVVYSYFSNYVNVRGNIAIQTENFIQQLLKGRISVYQFLRAPTEVNKQKVIDNFKALDESVLELKAKLVFPKNIELSNEILVSSKEYVNNFNIVVSKIIENQNNGIKEETEEIKNTIPEQKQESNRNEEKQINNISNKNETKTNDVIEQVPEVDDEYNNLVNFVDYKADEFNKCHTDSIDVALSDTDNIRNTSCKQFAYNGKLVGYKIQVFYNDGTYKYYK